MFTLAKFTVYFLKLTTENTYQKHAFPFTINSLKSTPLKDV